MSDLSAFRILDARSDIPDRRDLVYRPSLGSPRPAIDPRPKAGWWCADRVRDQGDRPSCTGHALAAAVDHLLAKERLENPGSADLKPDLAALKNAYASDIMLYGNAQLHDEWDGEGYSGSSLRGALKGFQHNGLCSMDVAKKAMSDAGIGLPGTGNPDWRWYTNRLVVTDARNVVLGAYYRVPPVLTDMHCALEESGVLVATARVHDGWQSPDENHQIPYSENLAPDIAGYHAFVIIGYGADGWIVQNSWGRDWADDGVAVWSYADWANNVSDIWALRLAAPVTGSFRYSVGAQGAWRSADQGKEARARSSPIRLDILGHLLPIEDGQLVRYGRYHHDPQTLMETVRIIKCRLTPEKEAETGQAMAEDDKKADQSDYRYRHVLFHVLGGTRDEDNAARMVRALQPVYRANGIYPIFLSWESALSGDLQQHIQRLIDEKAGRTDAADRPLSDVKARLIEIGATGVPARIRRELERSVRRFFYELKPSASEQEMGIVTANGIAVLSELFKALSWRHRNGGISYHIVTHDLGARFATELLANYARIDRPSYPVISTLHFISPLVDAARFEAQVVPKLARRGEGCVNRRSKLDTPVIERAFLWHQSETQARVDRFHPQYPNAWPEFWARVMGLVAHRDGLNGATYEFVSEPGKNKAFPVIRSLALARYARTLAALADQRGWALDVREFQDGPEPGRIRHFDIDGTPQVVNGILESILGEDAVRRRLTDREWKASS
jgi:hypothetical protein